MKARGRKGWVGDERERERERHREREREKEIVCEKKFCHTREREMNYILPKVRKR